MNVTDPIADMFTRIRNAGRVGHETCVIPGSKIKSAIAEILMKEGYIQSYFYDTDNKQGTITVTLKYRDKRHVISGITRISKPGLRVYARSDEMPEVLGGLGIAIISTSKGVMTDKSARENHLGGEVMAYVW